MKVLMFGWEFPPENSGGLGVACAGLARALSRDGADVYFVLPRTIKTAASGCTFIYADNGIPTRVLSGDDRTLLSGYVSSAEYERIRAESDQFGNYKPTLIEEVRLYGRRARAIARATAHDIIHAHDWLSFLAGIEAKRESGKPLVVHVHATEFDRTGGHNINQAVYDIERQGLHAADKVIAVSNYTKNILVRRYGVAPGKIEVVHNGIDEDDMTRATKAEQALERLKKYGAKVVLFVGRVTVQKGPDYFIDLARRILAYRPNTVFVVAGSGDMERQIIEQAAWHGIGDKVFFAGFVRGEALGRLYRSADVVVMPSVSEPFGIVPFEALLNKTPVLISKQSGVSEVIPNALTVDFWDVDEMVNKVVAVLDHESLRVCLADGGLADTLKCGWNRAAKACAALYRRILAVFKT